ncbi:MAG: hypothetical protein M3065_02925 [Actinomycetota bacterium]|nr:hypothetical protein [Actinomycetota bacterium]
MRRSGLLVLLVALIGASLLAPPLAGAQTTSIVQFFGGTPFSVREIPVRFMGQLTVAFHGDAASGCASRGLCGYAGTVSWRPPASGSLEVFTFRHHGHLSYQLGLVPENVSGYPAPYGGVTTAKVQLSSSPPLAPTLVSTCLDATGAGSTLSLPVRHGLVAFTLAGTGEGSSLLGTRCAGPLDGDVIPEITAPTVPLGAVLRGRTAVDVAASHSFASHGFAGTVQSSLTIALGHPTRARRTSSGNAPAGLRQIQVLYRATLSGSVVERIGGAADADVCTPLGSCGLAGTVTLSPRATGVNASLGVIGSARTPYSNLLAAVGLSRRGRAKGVLVSGGALTPQGGVAASALAQGSTACRDSAPLGAGTVLLTSAKARLYARYAPDFGALGGRTRCPGPAAAAFAFVATGAIPVTRLARRTIKLSLTTGSTFADYGYVVRTVPNLTLTLSRVRVSTRGGFSSVISGSVGP